jgi:predicted transcriptional regulator
MAGSIPKKRDRLAIKRDILVAAEKGNVGVTQIVYGTNLNFKTVKPYLADLIERRLLLENPSGKGKRSSYSSTPAGLQFVKQYTKLEAQ